MEEVQVINKNFGSVLCGKKYVESIKLDNEFKTTNTFKVVPLETPNTGLERFRIYPIEAVVPPGKFVRFTLSYFSYVENIIDNISYNILCCDKPIIRLNVYAKTVGPLVKFTIINVKFYWLQHLIEIEKNIEIKNTSKCEAKYCFDLDKENALVDISKPEGILPAGIKLNLKLKFKPKEPGIFYRSVFCLVQFHKPILVKILGVCFPKMNINVKCFCLKYIGVTIPSNNYEAYVKVPFIDTEREKSEVIPKICFNQADLTTISSSNSSAEPNKKLLSAKIQMVNTMSSELFLTTYYIDLQNYTETVGATSLINLSNYKSYSYQWDHDTKSHFQVEPCKGIINPNTRIHFTIYFTPSIPDQYYHIEVDLRLLKSAYDFNSKFQHNIELPYTLTLRIIGHSFLNNVCGWIPQCKIDPKSLQLSTCIPEEITHGTFTIERQGHLPVVFTILLPPNSNYTVQPPLGYIDGNFQIFLVRFNGQAQEGIYKEDIKIIYNNPSENCDCIQLKTMVEKPKLIFANNNSYTFECTFPGSKTLGVIPVKNPTNLYLSYQFIFPENFLWVEIPKVTGLIEPKSSDTIEVIFKPEVPCEYLDYVQCKVSSVSAPNSFEMFPIQFIGSSQYGSLVAIPYMHDFGDCIYSTKSKFNFHLFNFSPVVLYFKLFPKNTCIQVGSIKNEIHVKPCRGCVLGKGSIEVEISVVPRDKELFEYELMCQILENDSVKAKPCEGPKKIFFFKFNGILPTFQIIDLCIDDGGPLFSPHWIWKMMSIDKLNKILDSPIIPEEEITLRFPEAEIGSSCITISLLMQAKKFGETSWAIKKNVSCDCENIAVKGLVSEEECIHSKAIIISPMQAKLAARERKTLRIFLHYINLDDFSINLKLILPFNRKIILKTNIVSLPKDLHQSTSASMYLNPKFNLKSIFIGDKDPPLQLFWLYNNTQRPASYVVDKSTLREATAYVHRIFDCLNPNGVIPPFSAVPLQFLFKPNEMLLYSAEIIICLREDVYTTVSLKGEGLIVPTPILELSVEKTIPEIPMIKNENISLECSINFIKVPHLRTFSEHKHIFFLRNTSKTSCWAFKWHSFCIDELLKAKVEPFEGTVEPQQEQAITIIVKSCARSSMISFSMPCDVINYSTLRSYESALCYSQILAERVKDYFTITEKGVCNEVPEFKLPQKPEPKHIFLTVSVNIVGSENVDSKLLLKQQLSLKMAAYKQPEDREYSPTMNKALPFVFNVFEKMLWNTLNSSTFKNKIRDLRKTHEYSYLQVLPREKNVQNNLDSMTPGLSMNFIQEFMEQMLKSIIFKNFKDK